MNVQLPRQLKNFNAYINGDSFSGRCDATTPPSLSFVLEEHRAGGMDAPIKIELGMEALTMQLVLSDYDPRIISLIGVDDIPVVLRGGLQAQGKAVEPVIVNARGMLGNTEFSEWKPGTKSTVTLSYELSYFRYRQNGVQYCEIDIKNMIREFGGVDQLAGLRAAL
jgi:P2 family phage contractile tail tube protein